jgi:hypothetical protein
MQEFEMSTKDTIQKPLWLYKSKHPWQPFFTATLLVTIV